MKFPSDRMCVAGSQPPSEVRWRGYPLARVKLSQRNREAREPVDEDLDPPPSAFFCADDPVIIPFAIFRDCTMAFSSIVSPDEILSSTYQRRIIRFAIATAYSRSTSKRCRKLGRQQKTDRGHSDASEQQPPRSAFRCGGEYPHHLKSANQQEDGRQKGLSMQFYWQMTLQIRPICKLCWDKVFL